VTRIDCLLPYIQYLFQVLVRGKSEADEADEGEGSTILSKDPKELL
jgi:hypothetical protein